MQCLEAFFFKSKFNFSINTKGGGVKPSAKNASFLWSPLQTCIASYNQHKEVQFLQGQIWTEWSSGIKVGPVDSCSKVVS